MIARSLPGERTGPVHPATEVPISNLYLPGGLTLAAIAVLGYMFTRFRGSGADFTLVDALIVAVAVAVLGAAGIPLIERASAHAKNSSLLQSLHTLRAQIELYRLEHNGAVPVLVNGTFPQLIRSTNAVGEVGLPGKEFPYGPYLESGVPVNPITGRSIVTAVDSFPPSQPTGNGGWVYHQPTGQLGIDLEGYLDR